MLQSRNRFNFAGVVGRAVALALIPAALLLFLTPAVAGDDGQRKVQIKVVADADGEPVELDLSDLQVGETRWVTSDSGKDVGITREENGYRLDIDGEETFIMSPGEGMHNRVMVHAMTGADGDDLHDAMSNVWVSGDHQVIELDDEVGDTVFISGLGDLDQDQKDAIIDALRANGVEKEIHFAPAGGPHMMSFTTSTGDLHMDDDATVDVQVLRKQLEDGGGEGGNHVILIEKKVVTGDEEND